MSGFLIAIFITFVWLLLLSLIALWIFKYFRRLSKEVDKGNLIKLLEKVLINQDKIDKSINDIYKNLEYLNREGLVHLQKVGLVRFNPFEELGGDHSFSLALLDGSNNGVIITGLHTRERTRVYIKDVKKGKSELELSDEENKALKIAQKK